MTRTKYFDIETPILSKVKTPLDSFNVYIFPIGLLIILGMFVYIFILAIKNKEQEEI